MVGLPQVGCATQHCESQRFATSKCTVLLCTTDDKAVFLEKYEKKGTIASDCMILCDKYLNYIDLLQMAAYVVYSNFLVTHTHTLSSSLYP